VAASLEMNYCPRCGHSLEDRYVFARTRRVCPACEFIFWREHKVAAAAIVAKDGQVLLVRRTMTPGKGKWTVPGGFVEFDEDPREAVVREVLEETGYRVQVARLLDVVFGREHDRGASLVIVYLADLLDDQPTRKVDENEVDAVGFFPPDELPPIAFKATTHAITLWRREK
jgi:ADP-ribose pyrophosphatase YjhB (NUDIX family)